MLGQPGLGTIDLPMYEWLLNADLVVADLSTCNVNTVFELGVRYALRPQATIIVADDLQEQVADPVTALNDALDVLRVLKPESCSNPETLGLYGAIDRRLWRSTPHPICWTPASPPMRATSR